LQPCASLASVTIAESGAAVNSGASGVNSGAAGVNSGAFGVNGGTSDESGVAATTLRCACECVAAGLVALGFSGDASIYFAAVSGVHQVEI